MAARSILVADDDPRIGALLKLTLEGAGYRVTPAFTGREALEKARAERPDLVILDVAMPELDGYHVAFRLKNDSGGAPPPKIVMLTARTESRDHALGRDVGADAYMDKPFSPRALVRMVDELLAQPQETPS